MNDHVLYPRSDITRVMVVGFPRSGTTLISQHLANSFGLVCYPESHFLSYYFSGSIYNQLKRRVSSLKNRSWIEFQQKYGIYSRSSLSVSLNFRKEASRYFNYLDTGAQAVAHGASGWLEKTPNHLELSERVIKAFNNIKVVAVIRNPVDAIASYLDVTSKFPNEWGGRKTFPSSQDRWKKYAELIANLESNERFLVIKYEDFVKAPSGSINRASLKLQLKFNPIEQTAPMYEFEHWKKNNKSLEILQRSSKRDEVMTESEKKYCLEYLMPIYEKLGNL